MSKGTLLFYINAIHEGGAERVILQLAKHFAIDGYKSVLVTSFVDENEYPVPDAVERISIEKEQKHQGKLARNISRISALRKIIKEHKPSAVISFMAEPNFRAIVAGVGLKSKTIVSVRNDPNREYAGRLGRFIGKRVIPYADGVVFQTEDAKQWFPKAVQEKSKVIFNDVDPVFFETRYIGGKDIVTLGRLSEQKNHRLLIEAFSRIADKHPEVNLLIYGTGQLADDLSAYINDLELEKRVFLMGNTTEAEKVLSTAGYFVLSSDYEGMPNALMEALAVGVPSISTDCPCGGPKTLINDGENGMLVPVNDVAALSAAMDRLLSDSDLSATLGKNAKRLALNYKTDRVFAEWKKYVEKQISNCD